MHKDIMLLMRRLGLRDPEGQIYLTCLQNRDGLFTFEIVKQTHVNRSTVDLIVGRLLKRGFLNKMKVGRRMRYSAVAPETIMFHQKKLIEDLEQVMPMLTKIGAEKKEMDIIYFEGAEGFRRVHDDVLLQTKFAAGEKKHILSFTSGPDTIRLYPNLRKTFIDRRIKNGTWYKAVATDASRQAREWTNDPKSLREVRYLPKDHQLSIETQIYADNVMLYSPTAPVGGVIIRNEKIADSLRTIFELLWKTLPEEKS